MTRTLIIIMSFVTGLFTAGPAAFGAVPVTGKPVPELAAFDTLVCDFMTANAIDAGLLGIMVDGEIVYQRGFGWADEDQQHLMRHDDLMRIASITKPFTAAAIQRLYATTGLDPDDNVFDLGQQDGGILNIAPFGSAAANMDLISVQDVLSHTAGFPSNLNADPMFAEITIADTLNNGGLPTNYPPGVARTTQWLLAQPLLDTPGNSYAYSNLGFMVLGQVVEEQSGMDHLDYVRQNILGPIDWLPTSEVVLGRTQSWQRDAREPYYDTDTMRQNVFDPDGPNVNATDGGYHHEQHFASGALVASTTTLLHLAENYYVNGENANNGDSDTYGLPVTDRDTRRHGGLLWGVSSTLQQRADGVNFALVFNKGEAGVDYAAMLRPTINVMINDGIAWPTEGVDGQWVDFSDNGDNEGSFEEPWQDVQQALSQVASKGTLNMQPGSENWTGTIDQPLRIRAPYGTVTIGN